MDRLFTLTEAEQLLPTAEKLLRVAMNARHNINSIEEFLNRLGHRILTSGGMTVDTGEVRDRQASRQRGIEALQNSMQELDQLGIQVKDLDTGLVDFPTLFGGERVLLCWKLGETSISHWHGLQDGFAGRKEINQDFINQHRGQSHQ